MVRPFSLDASMIGETLGSSFVIYPLIIIDLFVPSLGESPVSFDLEKIFFSLSRNSDVVELSAEINVSDITPDVEVVLIVQSILVLAEVLVGSFGTNALYGRS